MKKLFILGFFILVSQVATAQTAKHSEEFIDQDLSYKVDVEEDASREVASEDEIVIDESNVEDGGDRGVASDQDDKESKIKFWKY